MPGGQSKKGRSDHHPIRPLHLHSQPGRSNALRRQHGRPAEYWWRERKQLQRFCKLLRLSITLGNGDLLTFLQVRKLYKYFSIHTIILFLLGIMLIKQKECWKIRHIPKSCGGAMMVEASSYLRCEQANNSHSPPPANALRRMKDSPSRFCPNISNIAISPASCASLTNMTSTRCDTIMKRMGTPRTDQV